MIHRPSTRFSGIPWFALLPAGLLVAATGLSGCAERQMASSSGEGSVVPASYRGERHMTRTFAGAKVNGGTAIHSQQGRASVLTLSDDFKVPDTPAPHWQVVDSKGNTYLLQRLVIKGDKLNKSITVPGYVQDIAKVQIWCAWAETLLGEAPFEAPVR